MSLFKIVKIDNRINLVYDNLKYGNAFSIAAARELHELIDSENFSRATQIYFKSAGSRFFCAGGNMKDYAQLKAREEGIAVNHEITSVLNEFSKLPAYKVVYLDGDCLGGGLELASCFDRLVAAPHSLFSFWQKRIGLTYGWGGGERWLKKISLAKLSELSKSTELLNAYQAKEMGLVDEVSVNEPLLPQPDSKELLSQLKVLSGEVFEDESKTFDELWCNDFHKSVLEKFKN